MGGLGGVQPRACTLIQACGCLAKWGGNVGLFAVLSGSQRASMEASLAVCLVRTQRMGACAMEITRSTNTSAALVAGQGSTAPRPGVQADFSDRLVQALEAFQQSLEQWRANGSSGAAAKEGVASVPQEAQVQVAGLAQLLGQFQQAVQSGSPASKVVTDAAAPEAPSAQSTALDQNTELWIRAALNQSMAQARANGYDPEKSHMVNTYRGYFSGDAQARSNAIHALDRAMLEAGAAYATNDGGQYGIAGKPPEGMDVSMPSFKTAYDKDWNRPSLYDMINSRFGWVDTTGQARQAVNYADPAQRDDTLNRKLSDEEIAAFQTDTLTPQLQALVNKYRQALV